MPAFARARRKFLRAFPHGFRDETYLEWERNYKWQAHLAWREALAPKSFRKLLSSGQHRIIARTAIAIESRTNLLFSFEKMALRDAVATNDGARIFADGLFGFLHGEDIPILQRVADPSPASRDFRNHRGIVFKGPPMGSSVFCEPASCRANRPAIAAVVARLPIQHDD